MLQEENRNNEIYWELLRRTPEYRKFYEEARLLDSPPTLSSQYRKLLGEYDKVASLREEQKIIIEDMGLGSTASADVVASLMATIKFGVRFLKKMQLCRPGRVLVTRPNLFSGTPVASIVSPGIPYNQAPCEISFFPPPVELVSCPDLDIPPEGESLRDDIIRTHPWKEEALFMVRLNKTVPEIVRDFEREIRKTKGRFRKAGKLGSLERPLYGKLFSSLSIRKLSINTFRRYIRWYDLHMGGDYIAPKGLPFRTIAYHEYLDREHPERAEEAKKRIKEKVTEVKTKHGKRILTGVIGEPIKGEDAVEKATKYIYRAIHRKPYPSRMSKQDLYNCPIHKEECPQECKYMKEWYHAFNRRHMKFLSSHIPIHESMDDPKGMKKPAKGKGAKIMGKIKHD